MEISIKGFSSETANSFEGKKHDNHDIKPLYK
jgi:hypothetical protein